MRILLLSHRYTDTTIGGLAEFLHYLPLSLKQFDAECILYTQAQNKNTMSLVKPTTLPNGMLHYSGPILKPKFFPSNKELQPLIDLCQQEKIDLIHAQGLYRAGFMAMQIQKKLGIPYVVTSHSDILQTNSERIHRGNIKRRCQKILKNAAFVTHLSPIMQEASDQILSTSDKSTIIHNGVDLPAWKPFYHREEKDYVLAIGRLEKEKGFPILIDAYAGLFQQGMKTSLIIAGSGGFEKELIAQAKSYELNVVTDFSDWENIPSNSLIFTGYVRGEDKKNLFAQAKLILFATQPDLFEEAFGIVQLEAMAAGKTMVASDMKMTQYLQSFGMEAVLVEPNNITAWMEAIQGLLAQDGLRKLMGQKNSEVVKQFGWDAVGHEYADVYKQITQN